MLQPRACATLAFALVLLARLTTGQQQSNLTITYVKGAAQCATSQYFDTSSLSCTSCPAASVAWVAGTRATRCMRHESMHKRNTTVH